ncbi:PIN domain-containing protein [Patescibacteria group bacterium]|nr:PIN domain-containing protein [Patescibacteria group bacterium]MBU1967224.1 PIN domain-containing protein [Patescibacteria group bacterium]MBU2543081.1 PIN domain-containing protein [Patescibacteria group bacterium]
MKSDKLIVDSNVLVGFYIPKDTLHQQAINIIKQTRHLPKIINDYLLSEITTLILIRGKNLSLATKIGQDFINDTFPKFSLTQINKRLNQQTLKIFRQQTSNKLSFADCSIIAQAKIEKILTIITFDKHIRQEFKGQFDFLPKRL